MKHNDSYSKKLIKNFVYLVVSALVLVSATVAWFSKNSQSDVSVVSAEMKAEKFEVGYYKTNVSGKEFVYDQTENKIVPLTLSERKALPWTATNNIDIEEVYPGSFNTFRMDVIVNKVSAPSLVFKGISFTGTDDAKTVYDSVFLYAVAVDASGNIINSVSGSFSSFMDGETDDMMTLNIGNVMRNDTVMVYFDIGIPGYDVNGTHAKLQETGAGISIESVEISE